MYYFWDSTLKQEISKLVKLRFQSCHIKAQLSRHKFREIKKYSIFVEKPHGFKVKHTEN